MDEKLLQHGLEAASTRHRTGESVYLHADDLGATPTVTNRLCESWDRGLLDSFSIFGNSDHLELIADRLAAQPERPARFSVHLTLTEGRPADPTIRAASLVDRDGCLNAEFAGLVQRLHWDRSEGPRLALLAEVEREWRAQIENVLKVVSGRPVAALDGHLHVHMIPALFRLAVKLATEYGIPEVRNVREPFHVSQNLRECFSRRFFGNCVKREILTRFSRGNAIVAEDAGVGSPDRMLGVLYSGMMSRSNIASGIAASRRLGAKRIEVLVHIGRANHSELARWNGRLRHARFVLSPYRDVEFLELMELRSSAPPWEHLEETS